MQPRNKKLAARTCSSDVNYIVRVVIRGLGRNKKSNFPGELTSVGVTP